MKNKGLKILLSVLLVLCIIMAGALIGKEYIGDNIKEAANRNGVDVVKDTSDTGKEDENAVDSTAEGTANTQSDAAKAETTEADTQQPQMSTIVITATGDCTLGNNQEQSYDGSFNSYYDSKGQDYFFGGVRDIFEADDMTLINLECVLSDATERVEKRWNLKGKPEYIGIMTGSSIEACSLGNNHTYDYGQAGLDDTRNVLDNAGIVYGFNDHTGIYETADGTRIGIVSVSLLSQNGDREAYIQNGIAQLREQGAAIVIACCHWGIEGDHYPNDYQQAAAHRIIDWGADLVVGNHPHVLQGMEVYNGKMICYSLGNFCFGGNSNPGDKDTMIYRMYVLMGTNADGTHTVRATQEDVIPCRLSSVPNYNNYQPIVLIGSEAERVIAKIQQRSNGIAAKYGVTADTVVCDPRCTQAAYDAAVAQAQAQAASQTATGQVSAQK